MYGKILGFKAKNQVRQLSFIRGWNENLFSKLVEYEQVARRG